MVQLEGSSHDWFEGRGPRWVLMVTVDDAASRLGARFFEPETRRAANGFVWRKRAEWLVLRRRRGTERNNEDHR